MHLTKAEVRVSTVHWAGVSTENTLGESQARAWAPRVRINSIIVGLVKTEQAHLHYGDDAGIAAVAATIPLERMASPEDIGNACLYLSGPLSGSLSGTSLTVHGGGEKPSFLDAANP